MPHLDGGPAWERWLYEQPIPTMIAIIAMGVLSAYMLRQKGLVKWTPAPMLAALVLATGVWSLASVVETGRESMANGTRAFITAMLTGDRFEARSQLDRDVLLAAAGTEFSIDVDALAAISLEASKRVNSFNLRKVSSTQDGPNVGRTRFDVTLGVDGAPMPMGWELGWQRRGGSWAIVRAECLHIYNKPPQNMFRNWLPRLRR